MKYEKCLVVMLLALVIVGCDTDIRPTYFSGMFRDEADIDGIFSCLSEVPEVDGDIITVKGDIPCLIELSNTDTTDPNMDASFEDILDNTEKYLGKIVTFEATVKYMHHNNNPELYTGRHDVVFSIDAQGAEVYTLNEGGEKIRLSANVKYRFTCQLNNFSVDQHRVKRMVAHFLVRTDRQIIYQPELAE